MLDSSTPALAPPAVQAAEPPKPASLPQRRRHLVIIYNPTAGRRRRRALDGVIDAFTADGGSVTLRSTTRRGDALAYAHEVAQMWPEDRPDALVVAGGDGTVNEVVNGLAAQRDGERGATVAPVPLGLIALGTANVLAHELGLPVPSTARAQRTLAAILREGPIRPMHVGEIVELPHPGRSRPTQPPLRFVQMAGVGFDAHVVAHVGSRLKKRLGKFAYVLQSGAQLWRGVPGPYRLSLPGADGAAQSREVAAAILAKGHFYGGRFVAAPEASPDLPRLDACLFGRGGPIYAALYGAALTLGRLPAMPGYGVEPVTELTIDAPTATAASREEPVQADGDIVASLPVRIAVAAAEVAMIRP